MRRPITDVVRIMTIHKSKGLEFPICIIGGMGHAIHAPDKSILTIHPDIAMVMPVVDNEKRTKKKTIYTHYLKYVNAQDELGEAMRKLYVAMTRAKEKLILLGCAKNTDSAAVTGENRQKIKTFFDMVLPAVHIRTDLFHLVEVETDDLILQVEHGMVQETVKEQALYNFDTTICYDKPLQEMYEWMDAADEPEPEPLPVKVSVSDLKIQSMEELDMEDFTILTHEEKEEEKPVPAFMQTETKEKSANRGALYGTIWHQVMAVIDFVNTEDEAQIRKEVKRLVETGRLCESDTEVLNYRRLSAFFDSTLGRKCDKHRRKDVSTESSRLLWGIRHVICLMNAGKMRQFWFRESLMDIMRPMTELCSWITKPIRLSPGMKKCLYRVIGDRWSYTGMHWKK